jgi:hypothetical protein
MEFDRIREVSEGRARTGFVDLVSFDQGVIETLGAVLDEKHQNYFLTLPPITTVGFDPPPTSPFHRGCVAPRPGLPGVPVTFSNPQEIFEKYSLPMVLVRREGEFPALERWHPGLQQYRVPGRGALPFEYTDVTPSVAGFDRVEQVTQAIPYDISYSVVVVATKRGFGVSGHANRLFGHMRRIFQPYCLVKVIDSIGDYRTYDAFQEGINEIDEVPEINDRVIGFSISLRIAAELDDNDPVIRKTVTRRTQTFRPR